MTYSRQVEGKLRHKEYEHDQNGAQRNTSTAECANLPADATNQSTKHTASSQVEAYILCVCCVTAATKRLTLNSSMVFGKASTLRIVSSSDDPAAFFEAAGRAR